MVPVLPESAPFTEGQRAWLNGFLAGLLSMAAAPGAGRPGAAAPAAAAAAATATPAAGAPAAAADEPWHDPDLPLDERLARAEGRPLGSRLAACMAQLDCHACGYDLTGLEFNERCPECGTRTISV